MTGPIGRDAEIARTTAPVATLEAGEPAVVLVAGEAGIGKTRLLQAAMAEMDRTGVRVLLGRCLDLRTARVPFAPLVEALRAGPPRMVDDALDALTGVVEVDRARRLHLVRDVICRLAEQRPTVLVLEDLHWVDDATRDAVLFLLSAARVGRWAFIASYRDTEVRARPGLRDLLAQLGRHPRLERVHLERLDLDEVTAQVELLTGRRPDAAWAREVHRRSGGVPLAVEELVAASTAGFTGVPSHVAELHLARVDALPPVARDLVRLAAVAGAATGEDLLAAASGLPPEDLVDALETAVGSDCLVVDGTEVGFRHELLREAVYDGLVPQRRRELHRAVARALNAAPTGSAAARAHHWYEADDPAEAATAALEAAADAERVHAQADVHMHLERVLGLWEHLPAGDEEAAGGRVAVLARAAEAAHLAGAMHRAVALAEEAVSTAGDDDASAARWERLARYRWGAGEGEASEAAYEEALRRLTRDTARALQVQALAGFAWLLGVTGRPVRAGQLADRAMAIADSSGDRLQRCRALLGAMWAVDDAKAAVAEARDLAAALGADDELARAHVGLIGCAVDDGRIRAALDVACDGVAMARERHMDRNYRVLFTGFEVEQLVRLGEWDEATRRLGTVLGPVLDMPSAWVAMHAATLAAACGDRKSVGHLVDDVLELARRVPQQPGPAVVVRIASAEDRLWAGLPEEALEIVMAGLRQDLGSAERADLAAPLVARGLWAVADLVVAARRVGPSERMRELRSTAAELVDALEPSGDPMAAAEGVTARAERTRFDNRPDPGAWEAAVRAWDDLENPYRAACARWRLAECLVALRSERSRAADLLDDAWRAADRLGARPLREAIEELAATARLSITAAEPALDPAERAAREAGLTPREREVLDIVAAGRTNRQIAELLVISDRTVGVHVSRILRKLGAARRTEAVEVARRRGILGG